MQSAFLIGPYLGELSWEILRLAPFVAHMKKVYDKKLKIIVLTRPSRFDLHGLNADILIPLVLQNDKEELHDGHGIKGFDIEDYDKLLKEVRKRLLSKYEIEEHFYFDLSEPFRRVKFQTMRGFTRAKLYYNFQPRPGNKRAINLLVKNMVQMIYIDTDVSEQEKELLKNYVVFDKSFFEKIRVGLLPDTSFFGCCMELMKKCKFVIGSLENPVSLLALMLGIPLMIISEKIREDEVKMLNPVHTPIIHCPNLERGLTIYETNF